CTVGLIMTFALGLCVGLRATDAQQPVKVPLIGVLGLGSYPSEAQRQQSPFLQALRELGWSEGETIVLERRYAAWQLDRLPTLAADLVRLRPDVIFVRGTPGVQAAQQATTTIPIVTTAGSLVEQGIVTSLAHPGGNTTGVDINILGLSG